MTSSIANGSGRYDASVWTASGEDRWLGWLDVVARMRPHVDELNAFAESAVEQFDAFVLLGMGGSSLAPEVLRRTFAVESFHVLDTTHPAAIRRLERNLDLERTLFLVSVEVGLDARDALAPRVLLGADRRPRRASSSRSPIPARSSSSVANERGFRAIFPGEPEIGGRYSALSMFGMVPAALMGVDVERFLRARGRDGRGAVSGEDGNPGLELGLRLGEGWRDGRDKVCLDETSDGLRPLGRAADRRVDRQAGEGARAGAGRVARRARPPARRDPASATRTTLGQEFYRWEFATAVAGHVLGINPFDQPDVQAAKDKTNEVLAGGEPDLSSPRLARRAARPGGESDYVCIQAFIDPAREHELEPLIARAHETGCVVTNGLGPRYLHSTGQLHKGGPNTGLFIQVVDDDGGRGADPRPRLRLRPPDPRAGGRRLRGARGAGPRAIRIRLEDI